MRVPEHPTQIRRMLNARLARLAGTEPMLAASLVEVQRRCGQPSCHCHKGGLLHTAHQITFKDKGKSKTVYVPHDLLPQVRLWVENHKRHKALLAEIHLLSVALVRTHAQSQKRKGGRT